MQPAITLPQRRTRRDARTTVVVKHVLRLPATTTGRYRLFWFAVAAICCGVLFALGASYALGGDAVTRYPPAFRVIRDIPGGMRAHGCILAVLGLSNLFGLGGLSRGYSAVNWLLVRLFSLAILGYSCWCLWAILAASVLEDQYDSGVWWYVLIVALSLAIVVLPPPFRGQRASCGDCQLSRGSECA